MNKKFGFVQLINVEKIYGHVLKFYESLDNNKFVPKALIILSKYSCFSINFKEILLELYRLSIQLPFEFNNNNNNNEDNKKTILSIESFISNFCNDIPM